MGKENIWEVDIDIVGAIAIRNKINFNQEKGFDNQQFYSNIVLQNDSFGVASTVTAKAENSDVAKTAAFVFMGRMIDVIVLDNDIPLVLQDHNKRTGYVDRVSTRRVLKREDFITAFNVARTLELEHPQLLKSIGWYAKGKVSNNTLDSFLSYWNAIEITAINYHTATPRTEKGVINKVYQCFLEYFGEVLSWDVPETWINEMCDKRNRIAYGGEETTAEAINNVALLIPLLSKISKKLICKVLERKYHGNIFEQEKFMMTFNLPF